MRLTLITLGFLVSQSLAFNLTAAESFLDRDFLVEITGRVATALPLTGGKILIGGELTSVNGFPRRGAFVRLNANGEFDSSYIPTGLNFATGLYRQPSGDLLAFQGQTIYRLNAAGDLNATSNATEGDYSGILEALMQPDGKIIVAGEFTTLLNKNRNYVARLNSDGTLDDTFAPAGFGSKVTSILLQEDGKIIFGGGFSGFGGTTRRGIARFDASGNLDITFNFGGSALPQSETIVDLQWEPNGAILAVGYGGVYRLNASGTRDQTFHSPTLIGGPILCAEKSDDKLFIGGFFRTVDGQPYAGLARLNSDGTLDHEFQPVLFGEDPSASPSLAIFDISAQADGKVLLGGSFKSIDNESRFNLARLVRSPAAPVPLLAIRQLPSVSLFGVVGAAYRIEYATNLTSSPWFVLTNVSLPTSPFTYVDISAPEERRFYRSIGNP